MTAANVPSQPDPARQGEPTIEDVAAAAGVSIRTVSRVLNKSPKVNAQTRERIEAAIAALRFRPSLRARALAMRRSFLIGLIHNDRNALVLDSIQRGIVSVTAAQGYELIVHSTPPEGPRPLPMPWPLPAVRGWTG
ncbi:LacI family DNA-binding transcriptional regulator [Novosphingobium pokkalii]|uniref:LacI family DNA-binding transcriptional regulator n=1 Tax=Novosphingobium pokkalii TaxID=1770194 RepID=UPI00362E7E86